MRRRNDNHNPPLLLPFPNINYLRICILSKIWTEGVLPANAKRTGKKKERTIGKTNHLSKKQKVALKPATHGAKSTQNPFIIPPAE